MTRSEALALVGTIQAAFPAGAGGDETAMLYAKLMEAEDVGPASKAVESMVTNREEAFLPTWAEISREIKSCKPQRQALPEPDGVLPPPEFHEARRRLAAATSKRSEEIIRRPAVALGEVTVHGNYLKILNQHTGFVIWEYELTGNEAMDRAEIEYGTTQCGLQPADVWAAVRDARTRKGAA